MNVVHSRNGINWVKPKWPDRNMPISYLFHVKSHIRASALTVRPQGTCTM